MIDSIVKIENIGTFKKLINRTKSFVTKDTKAGEEEEEEYSRYKDKYQLLSIVDKGLSFFPPIYQEPFLNPIKKALETQVFEQLLEIYFSDGRNVLGDWISTIDQRIRKGEKLWSKSTMAFTELCSDIYDGYVSKSARKEAALPENQILAPLTKWGGTEIYTHSVRIGTNLGIKVSVISIPSKWSQHIALWPLSVHECYHDVVDAYEGLLNEVEDMIAEEFESSTVKEKFTEKMNWNGEERSIPEFASEYWRRTMSETLADICSLLNLGPSAGISFALFAISQNSNLTPSSYIDDPHPDSVLRIVIAREVTKQLKELDFKVRNDYVKYFDKILEQFVYKKDNLMLYTTPYGEGKHYDCIIPFKSMEKTIEILVEKVAFTRLRSLGNHSLSEINAWTNRDQVLVERIANDLLKENKKEQVDAPHVENEQDDQEVYAPHLRNGPDGQEVYAAHIVAAATLALTNNPDIESISKKALESLEQMYKTNPVWGKFPIAYRSDIEKADTIVAK